jgi:exodeoxyribonuclease VII large subunit
MKKRQLSLNQNSLNLLNPDTILQRGYAIIQDSTGKVVQSIKQAKHHAKVQISLSDGKVSAIIDRQNTPEQGELI